MEVFDKVSGLQWEVVGEDANKGVLPVMSTIINFLKNVFTIHDRFSWLTAVGILADGFHEIEYSEKHEVFDTGSGLQWEVVGEDANDGGFLPSPLSSFLHKCHLW